MDIDFFKENSKNVNQTATNTWIKNYRNWAEKNDHPSDIELVYEASVLNAILESYFCHAKKLDGGEYEPTSVCALQAGIDRYLKENGSLF